MTPAITIVIKRFNLLLKGRYRTSEAYMNIETNPNNSLNRKAKEGTPDKKDNKKMERILHLIKNRSGLSERSFFIGIKMIKYKHVAKFNKYRTLKTLIFCAFPLSTRFA